VRIQANQHSTQYSIVIAHHSVATIPRTCHHMEINALDTNQGFGALEVLVVWMQQTNLCSIID